MMKSEVETAVEELREAFPDSTVTAVADSEGGAYVTVDPVELGEQYVQGTSWIKFHITFQYPYSDVYPHFVVPNLQRKDGASLGEGLQPSVTFTGDGTTGTQISRRSNKLNPAIDTAALKLAKVLHWLRSQ
ncbi:hypothetical protein [Arthrobacter sp. STN4]|uniref:hypothetical protein n=1 Tax=Arthrobacter sp. STN4 TaxID=2923276 RepID=UPI00211A10C3|nr:hypothetical protein [Arthrobacter sp. STN4]MCQ9163107.1 hypothetical protein [Arthrobacter sp. STN4]